MRTVPLRASPALGAMTMLTVPFPFPGDPDATVIQLASLAAVHVQPLMAVTVVLRVPPPDVMVVDAGLIWNVHVAASWRI
jgi:hypothetical protein